MAHNRATHVHGKRVHHTWTRLGPVECAECESCAGCSRDWLKYARPLQVYAKGLQADPTGATVAEQPLCTHNYYQCAANQLHENSVCWQLIHSRGKRCTHAHCAIAPDGRIGSRAIAADGEGTTRLLC
eukprot:20500-Heterococcus_DN1.PRE.1